MATYKATIENATNQELYFVLCKKSLTGLDTVAWQVLCLSPQVSNSQPSKGVVTWKLNYGVCIPEFDEEFGRYNIITSKTVAAKLGETYVISSVKEVSTAPVSDAHHDLINLENGVESGKNLGFTVSDVLVGAERNVPKGKISVFHERYSYFVLCVSEQVLPGTIMNSNFVIIPGIDVSFPHGIYECIVQAYVDSTWKCKLKVEYPQHIASRIYSENVGEHLPLPATNKSYNFVVKYPKPGLTLLLLLIVIIIVFVVLILLFYS